MHIFHISSRMIFNFILLYSEGIKFIFASISTFILRQEEKTLVRVILEDPLSVSKTVSQSYTEWFRGALAVLNLASRVFMQKSVLFYLGSVQLSEKAQ